MVVGNAPTTILGPLLDFIFLTFFDAPPAAFARLRRRRRSKNVALGMRFLRDEGFGGGENVRLAVGLTPPKAPPWFCLLTFF